MRALALILSFCISFNVLAATGTVQELERVFDEYNYSLTVEWDQKDQVFYQNQTRELFNKLVELTKAEGITSNDILVMAEKKMGNKQEFESLKLKLSVSSAANSTEDLVRILQENSKQFYSHGASWNGEILRAAGVVLAVGAFIAFLIWAGNKHSNDTCVQTDYVQQCGWYSYTQYSQQLFQCWYEQVCTEWQTNP